MHDPTSNADFLSCENKVLTYLLTYLITYLLTYLLTNLRRADRVWQTKQRFLLSSLGPLTFAFHETALDLACKLSWELSHWVVSFIPNRLQNYLSRFFRTVSLPLHFLSSKPSFLGDHFTNPTSGFFRFFSSYFYW